MMTRTFPNNWKKANVLPVHKKESRQIKKNYRPISLLPIGGKIFEKLIFDAIYEHVTDNQLLTPNQSGFRLGDSTINQLLYITQEFPSRETHSVFLYISKAFDKVWHDGLILKLKNYGISGPLLVLIESYLSNPKQRIVLNGKCSEWSIITAGVPQGSVLGPLFFLVYIMYQSIPSLTIPPGDHLGFAHSSCPRGRVFAPLSYSGVCPGPAPGGYKSK